MTFGSLPYLGMTLPEATIKALDGGVIVAWGIEGKKGVRVSFRAVEGDRIGPALTVCGKDAMDGMRLVIGVMGGRKN